MQKDIRFKDLGLLIIDEEQRFGVTHKEKLKKFKKSVEVLTLTAMPIPRTLQLSLLGAKDMSIINTPPKDRLPIQTSISRFDKELIAEAILREADRGGQVYFVHNRVESINSIYNLLRKLLPDLGLAVAHGQMEEKVLEKIGRLKERYRRVARRYEIAVTPDESNRVKAITWERKEQNSQSGFYCLRSNLLDFKEQELFDIFSMLADIEDAFRSMKSDLGLRPVYHQNEHRADGHLFITVLAYHVLHAIRFRLRKRGLTQSWSTIRKGLATHMRITTTMKRDDGKIIHIRKSGWPEIFHKRIYDALRLPLRPGKTVKTIL